MDRQQRIEILTSIVPGDAERLADRILDGSLGEFALLDPPTVGMVMARVIEGARGEQFNLGEVLVTRARVSVADQEGWGMVLGRQPGHALAVAIVDAGLAAGHPATEAVDAELEALALLQTHTRARDWAALSETRVHFETF